MTQVNSDIRGDFSICGKNSLFQSRSKQPLKREELPSFSFHVVLWALAAPGLDCSHVFCHLGWLVFQGPEPRHPVMNINDANGTVGPQGQIPCVTLYVYMAIPQILVQESGLGTGYRFFFNGLWCPKE